jgi:phosphohistidine phosphatase
VKTLFLLRHAKAEIGARGQSDFDRSLNDRGEAAALAMGREFKRLHLAASRIVSSPAARTRETLAQVAVGYGGRMPVDYAADLYLAAAETLLACIRGTEDRYPSLLLVGHNPGIQQLASLLGEDGPLRREIVAKYPTGALTEIALPVEHWAEAGAGRGRIERFLRPNDLSG